MARRRHENGLKKQQRIQREQHVRDTGGYMEPDDRHPEAVIPEPVPPGATQIFETVAPPMLAPSPKKSSMA